MIREMWGSLVGLEKKVTQALQVPKDLQGSGENLVSQDLLATREPRVTWQCQELKGTKENEDLTGPLDFQGSLEKMVWMDVLEKKGTQDSQGIMKMQPQVRRGFLAHLVSLGKQDPWGLQDWDFLAHQEGEVNLAPQDTPA